MQNDEVHRKLQIVEELLRLMYKIHKKSGRNQTENVKK